MTISEHINKFNENLRLDVKLPLGVEVMNPFEDKTVFGLASLFYNKFYKDSNPRKLILGINPGRLGAGLTGIPFTDPVKLQDECGIPNDLKKIGEPSAGFVYDMINVYGGPIAFYSDYFIHSVCPLGFVKEGLNYNYYDSNKLEDTVKPFILESLKTILGFGVDSEKCYCLGNGKNYKFLTTFNKEHKLFEEIIPLPHPRWIVQYRRKRYHEFLNVYLDVLKSVIAS